MTNQEIKSLLKSLTKVGNLTGVKFSYAMARNFNILMPAFKSFDQDRIALAISCSKKDKDGKSIMKAGKNEFNQDVDVFDFEDQKTFDIEFKKLLLEEKDIKLFQITLDDVPKEITAEQMTGIYEIIKNEESVPAQKQPGRPLKTKNA